MRTSAAEVPPIGHPTTGEDTTELTEIRMLLPGEAPNCSSICCVIEVWRCCESTNTVGNTFPFQRICDWEAKLFPVTMRRTDRVLSEMALGDSAVIWGADGMPRQLLKPTIAVQVPADNIKGRVATNTTWSHATGLRKWTWQERIPPPSC